MFLRVSLSTDSPLTRAASEIAFTDFVAFVAAAFPRPG